MIYVVMRVLVRVQGGYDRGPVDVPRQILLCECFRFNVVVTAFVNNHIPRGNNFRAQTTHFSLTTKCFSVFDCPFIG